MAENGRKSTEIYRLLPVVRVFTQPGSVSRRRLCMSITVQRRGQGAPYQVIRDAVHIHPTLAEAVQSAVSALD